jgi:putative heme-binding domain-containing protein
MAHDHDATVRLQVATAARKIEGVDAIPLLLDVLSASGDDKLIPRVVWQNLHPLLETDSQRLLTLLDADNLRKSPAIAPLMPRVVDRIVATHDPESIVALVNLLIGEAKSDPATLQKCLEALARKLENRQISREQLTELRPRLEPAIRKIMEGEDRGALASHAALVAAAWKDPAAISTVRAMLAANDQPPARRAQALDALIAADDVALEEAVVALFASNAPSEVRAAALGALVRVDAPWVGRVVLENYSRLEPELRPRAIELLTERRAWAEALLEAIGRQEIPSTALNVNQVRQLMLRGDAELVAKVTARWGSVRSDRDPAREQVIADMRSLLRRAPGDAANGQQVFNRVCGQCHKLHGQGQDVGPDITLNGRNSFEQLLSNVFDPSLVIGAAYQARTVITEDGRVLTGLLAEESKEQIVLKTQGGKLETLPRADISQMKVSQLSLMPDELEKQLKPHELADLFSLLTLDKPPGDPSARRLPGSGPIVPRATTNPAEFAALVNEVAPGFSTNKVGAPGLELLAEHAGRAGALRTQPVSRQEPCVLRGRVTLPSSKRARLLVVVAAEAGGTWNLVVIANGKRLHNAAVGGSQSAWQTIAVDLGSLPSGALDVELRQSAIDAKPSTAYWNQVEIVSE